MALSVKNMLGGSGGNGEYAWGKYKVDTEHRTYENTSTADLKMRVWDGSSTQADAIQFQIGSYATSEYLAYLNSKNMKFSLKKYGDSTIYNCYLATESDYSAEDNSPVYLKSVTDDSVIIKLEKNSALYSASSVYACTPKMTGFTSNEIKGSYTMKLEYDVNNIGDLITYVIDKVADKYPLDGIHSDGCYYRSTDIITATNGRPVSFYARDGFIPKHTFVDFNHQHTTVMTNTENVTNTGYKTQPVQLEENLVLLVHSGGGSRPLSAKLFQWNESTGSFDIGTDTVLYSTSYSGNVFSAVALSPSRVLVVHYETSNSSTPSNLMATLCAVNNGTITVITSTVVANEKYDNQLCIEKTNDGKIIIAHNSAISVISVLGDNIALDYTKSTSISGNYKQIAVLDDGRIFFASSSTGYADGYFLVLGADTLDIYPVGQLFDQSISNAIGLVTLSDNRLLFVYAYGSYTYGRIITSEGYDVTLGTGMQVGSTYTIYGYHHFAKLTPSNIVMTIPTGSSYYLGAARMFISGNIITTTNQSTIYSNASSGADAGICKLNSEQFMITSLTNSSYYYLFYACVNYYSKVIASTSKITGFTLEDVDTDIMGSVLV